MGQSSGRDPDFGAPFGIEISPFQPYLPTHYRHHFKGSPRKTLFTSLALSFETRDADADPRHPLYVLVI